MGNGNTDFDDMPERILAMCPPKDHPGYGIEGAWHADPNAFGGAEYVRADLCASGQQVRALMDASEYLAREYEKEGFPSYANLARQRSGIFTLCSIRAIEKAQSDALTPAPQAATPTAQEADPMMTDEEISEFISDYGHPEDTFSYLTPPQPSETVAEKVLLQRAVDLIKGDLTGSEWKRACNAFVKDALRALKGEDNGHPV